MPRSSVMRFESSAETSHSVAGGTSPVFDHDTVGSDNSSATQGSSTASVAGRKRAPTKQCAAACVNDRARNKSANAGAHGTLKGRGMILLQSGVKTAPIASSRSDGARVHTGIGGARERWALV